MRGSEEGREGEEWSGVIVIMVIICFVFLYVKGSRMAWRMDRWKER